MTDDLRTTIARAIRDAATQAHAHLATWLEDPASPDAITPEDLASLVTAEGSWNERPPRYLARPGRVASFIATSIVAHRDATLVHAVRLLGLAAQPALDDLWLTEAVLGGWSRAHGAFDAGALASALREQHLEDDELVGVALELGSAMTAISLQRLLEARAGEVVQAVEGTEIDWRRERRRAQLARVLSAAPVPGRLAEALVPYALDAPRGMVAPLRRALRGVPVADLVPLLASPKKDTRENAAEWLADRRDPAAVPALLAAMRKEKSDPVRAAIVGALEACGAPAPIDRAALEKDAAKLLSKGWPEALAFLDRDTLPALRWSDGAQVPRAIVEGWLITAHKAKDPEPSALVRALAARMEPEGPRSLARTVLDRFIAWDTRIPTDLTVDELDYLERIAESPWAQGHTREALLSRPDARNYNLPVRSAVAEKGVLGVVAALGGGDLTPTLESYVRTHRGFRASQSRAMLAVLSWIDDPRATQSLLRFASRFRTPGIQKEARLLAEALAARRGWTMAELADRTVPTAGLDDDGTLTLVYGRRSGDDDDGVVEETRRFIARLDESDALTLHDTDGAVVKALPDARKDEDEAVVAEAKKRHASARKDLKTLFAAQRDRLHEAMLGERRWPLGDFRIYFLEHPVLGRLARRTLFAAFEGDRLVTTFRPAGDGSFVGVENDTVEVDPAATVGLLHSSMVSRELDAAWAQHLGDYELLSLFPQLGRAPAPADRIEGGRITPPARQPALAVQVRSRAKRAGYAEVRGDGGIIESFTRSLPTLGRALVLELEGIEPDFDPKTTTAPVRGTAIYESGAPGSAGSPLAWSEVGSVLRDEAWNDLLAILD